MTLLFRNRWSKIVLSALGVTLVLCAEPSWSSRADWGVFCSKAQLIVVGTLRNVERDVHVLHYVHSPTKPNSFPLDYDSYYNEADLQIEEVLRGEPGSRRIRITWAHRTDFNLPSGKATSSEGDHEYDNGLRGIWMFADTSDTKWGRQHNPQFVSMDGLARVRAILSGSTRNIYR